MSVKTSELFEGVQASRSQDYVYDLFLDVFGDGFEADSERATPVIPLTDFKSRLWRDYQHTAHLTLLDDYLTKVTQYTETNGAEGIGRLIVEMPPRHGKSLTVARLYPAWHLGHNPDHRVMLASYGQDLANRHSRAARAYMRSSAYRKLFPSINLSRESASVSAWDVEGHFGGMDALGIGGSATGKGANCFPGDTLITTDRGQVKIRDIAFSPDPPRVLAYDHRKGCTVWATIEASKVVQSNVLIEVTTALGVKFKATPEHPIFVVGVGYIPADRLEVGHALISHLQGLRRENRHQGQAMPFVLRKKQRPERYVNVFVLQESIQAGALPARKSASTKMRRCVLLKEMFERASRNQERKDVRTMRCGDAGEIGKQILLKNLQGGGTTSKSPGDLWSMRRGIYTQKLKKRVLHTRLRKYCTLETYAGRRQFTLPTRQKLRALVFKNEAANFAQGRPSLCDLSHHGILDDGHTQGENPSTFKLGNSSHQRRRCEQHAGEFNHLVQDMSCNTPQVARDTVAMVRRIYTASEPVYDIQVEKYHNFFAESILAHNCLIIDDAIKNREQAESKTYRDKAWDAFTDDLYTRLEPGGAIIIMFTRWHEDDLIGRALANMPHEPWVRLRLPALAESNDPLGRDEGAALWPERYDEQRLQAIKETLGEYSFSSEYQQSPLPSGGGLFKTDNIEILDHEPICERYVRFYDLAVTAKRSSDYTVGLRMGLTHDERIIITHVYRVQKEFPDVEKDIAQNAQIDGKKTAIRLEAEKAGIIGLDYLLRRPELRQYTIDKKAPEGDKYTRAQPIAARVNAGRVALVRGHWNNAFIDELSSFPAGANDDQVDALSGAWNMMDKGAWFEGFTV